MTAALFTLGALSSLAWWPGTIDGPLTFRWAVLAVGVPFLLLLRREVAPFPWLLATFVALAGLSLKWTTDFLGGFDELCHLMILVGAFWLGASYPNLRSLWSGIAAGVGVSVLVAIAQLCGWEAIAQYASPSGLFSNRNFLAEACMVALIACLTLGLGRWLVVLLVVGVIIAGSKAVFGALLVALAFWLAPRHPRVAWGIMGSVTLLTFVLLTGATIPSAAARFNIWAPAFANLTWLGHGLGSFAATWPQAEFAHSEPLQLMFEFGIFSAILLVIAYQALKGWSNETETEFLVLVALLAVGLLAFPLHLPLTAFAASVAAGRLVRAGAYLGHRSYASRVAIGAGA